MTMTMSYRRRTGVKFPENLMVEPTGEGTPSKAEVQHNTNHNRAVIAYHRSMVGATSDLRPNERAILGLAQGIEAVFSHDDMGEDYYSHDIVQQLLGAFHDLLNYDLGRLDGMALSDWAGEIAARVGMEL
jgi:hypothetical protein